EAAFHLRSDLCDCVTDDSGGHCTAGEPWLKRGRPVPNHLSKQRSTPRIKQRCRRKGRSSPKSGLRALRPVQHTDGSARALRRHRHSRAREFLALSSSLPHCTAHWFCFRSHVCPRSSAIRHDQLISQVLTKLE